MISTHFYPYDKAGQTDGVAHGLKFVVSPLGYASMMALGITPETATDERLEAHARHCVARIITGGPRIGSSR